MQRLPDQDWSTELSEILYITSSKEKTLQLGADISLVLHAGDVLALSGDLGAGKSTFTRGLIRNLLKDPEQEVASPTYTLCNIYETVPQISHFDLYRLGDPQELDELGFEEAVETGCVVVEWPEKGFENLPENAVHVEIAAEETNVRAFRFSGNSKFLERIERSLQIRQLLDENGFQHTVRKPLDGDASSRRYERIYKDTECTHLLMDAPEMPDGPPVKDGLPYSKIAHLAENVSAFVAIGQVLRDNGLSAPAVPVMDLSAGILLVENLGDGKIINESRVPIQTRYEAAIDFLVEMHDRTFERCIRLSNDVEYLIPEYDKNALTIETELLLEWYVPEFSQQQANEEQKDAFRNIWEELFNTLKMQEQTLVLRDFHSPNIIWRPDEVGTDRVGVIDFQDAVIGPEAYDVASLAQDARVDVSEKLEALLVDRYVEQRTRKNAQFNAERFKSGYAVMSAQRATKILGIFCRLNKRDGKPQYMNHIPRIQNYLRRSLNHPVMTQYKTWIESVIEL